MAKTDVIKNTMSLSKIAFLGTIMGSIVAFFLGYIIALIQMAFAPVAYLIWAMLLLVGVWMLKENVAKAFTWVNAFVITLLMIVVASALSYVPQLAGYLAWANMATPLAWVQMLIYAILGLGILSKLYAKAL